MMCDEMMCDEMINKSKNDKSKNNELKNNEKSENENQIVVKVKTVVKTITQFAGWYMFIHTLFWGLEQIKYTWCHKGYIQSLIFSPTPMCIMLSETTNLITRTQITSLGTLFSFLQHR